MRRTRATRTLPAHAPARPRLRACPGSPVPLRWSAGAVTTRCRWAWRPSPYVGLATLALARHRRLAAGGGTRGGLPTLILALTHPGEPGDARALPDPARHQRFDQDAKDGRGGGARAQAGGRVSRRPDPLRGHRLRRTHRTHRRGRARRERGTDLDGANPNPTPTPTPNPTPNANPNPNPYSRRSAARCATRTAAASPTATSSSRTSC